MVINETTIAVGEQGLVKIPIGRLPSGNVINVITHVFRGPARGPTLLLLGGMHGDEINGVEIVRQAVQSGLFTTLTKGTVIAIPLLNVYGFINFCREVPDGKDLNRSFPGTSTGSLAARVAFELHKHILPLVDFGVDFHTGGNNNYNYPQIRYTREDKVAEALAFAFGAPLTLPYASVAKSLRKIALDKHQLPLLVFEGGENLRYDGLSIQYGLAGIRRLLQYQQMIDGEFKAAPSQSFPKTVWLRAPRGGLFQWMKASGNFVQKGEALGFISDPNGVKPPVYVHASRSGFIIGHNNTPVVGQGDALFHVAYADG